MELGCRHKQLQQGIERDDNRAGGNPSAQHALPDAQPPCQPLADVADQFQRADHAPHPPQQHRAPYHCRPPQTPDQQRHQIALGIHFRVHARRRVDAPTDHRQGAEHHYHQSLENVGKTAPQDQSLDRAQTKQVETFVRNGRRCSLSCGKLSLCDCWRRIHALFMRQGREQEHDRQITFPSFDLRQRLDCGQELECDRGFQTAGSSSRRTIVIVTMTNNRAMTISNTHAVRRVSLSLISVCKQYRDWAALVPSVP